MERAGVRMFSRFIRADNTYERSRSGKDLVNFSFLIGNFWPVALNKAHIVCARIQAQLPEPSCIKDLIRGGFTPVRPFLIKAFHAWMFRQLRHECFSFVSTGQRRPKRQLQPAYATDRNQLLRRLPELPVDEIGGEAAHERELFGLPWPDLEGARLQATQRIASPVHPW